MAVNSLVAKAKRRMKYLKCVNCEGYGRLEELHSIYQKKKIDTSMKKCVCENFSCEYKPGEWDLYKS